MLRYREINFMLENIIYIVHRENPEADNTAINFPDIYRNMLQVINEVVDKQLIQYRR